MGGFIGAQGPAALGLPGWRVARVLGDSPKQGRSAGHWWRCVGCGDVAAGLCVAGVAMLRFWLPDGLQMIATILKAKTSCSTTAFCGSANGCKQVPARKFVLLRGCLLHCNQKRTAHTSRSHLVPGRVVRFVGHVWFIQGDAGQKNQPSGKMAVIWFLLHN